jgi:CheY-like chemotaxis protein
VANGFAALGAVKQERPDAVVLDLDMPGLTGWDVIHALRADPATRGTPIVVVSGEPDRDTALETGADLCLAKPCAPGRLLAELLRLIDERTTREGEGA